MQEWIIAMLAVSILLILRDMAKTVLKGRKSKKEEPFPMNGEHPQKERVERYAASFQKLADTFYGMPYKKEYLSSAQVENVLREAGEHLCRNCYRRELCWGEQAESMYQGGEALVRAIEQADEGRIEELRKQWGEVCGKSPQYLESLRECFQREKQEMIWGNRCIVNRDFHTIHFVEDVSYQMLYGVARITREKEKVSGDNYICRQEDGGRFVMCLSDGMGSGMDACRESEIVVELLEQFLESGFSQETAARMVNSALVLNGREGMFSTVDICAVDLYTGICEFLKAGAAATFIRRDHWVEAISSESLAAGLVQRIDFDTASRKLYHGDCLVMMTDGVLDALPSECEEETMKEIILDVQESAPREISRGILERVLGYSDYRARDDMTVLVASVVRK